ncbi:unnamed protein product [Closterium sp. Naga37s-1]|nr:unnamed protein product [Closterium sp. Naga37s-1]
MLRHPSAPPLLLLCLLLALSCRGSPPLHPRLGTAPNHAATSCAVAIVAAASAVPASQNLFATFEAPQKSAASEAPAGQVPFAGLEEGGGEGEAQQVVGRVDAIEAELAQAEGGVGAERGAEREGKAESRGRIEADRGESGEAEGGGEGEDEGGRGESEQGPQAAGGGQRANLPPSPFPQSRGPLPPSWMPVPARRLGWAAQSAALPVIALDLFNTHLRAPLHMRCHGRACPAFSPCGDTFGNIAACWNPELSADRRMNMRAPVNCPRVQGGWRNATCAHAEDLDARDAVAFQAFRVHHVFVSNLGFVFNRTHRFVRNGCGAYQKFSFPPSARVRKLGRAINWAHVAGLAFFHMLTEAMPQLYNLAPLLPSFHRGLRLPLLASPKQVQVWDELMAPLVGIARDDVDLIVPPDGHLVFVRTLVEVRREGAGPCSFVHSQVLFSKSIASDDVDLTVPPDGHLVFMRTLTEPSRQYCGVPARGLWHSLRRQHLLHPQGLPIFHRNWTQRNLTPLTDDQMALLPADWVVLLVRRPGKERVMEREGDLEGSMRRVFGDRLVVYGNSLPILQARALFRRARLVVAVHGAGLSHTIFMPSNASVLEIRPRDYHNTCYHHLAEACDVNYYLMLGEGNKKGTVKADLGEVMGLVETIASGWKDEPG